MKRPDMTATQIAALAQRLAREYMPLGDLASSEGPIESRIMDGLEDILTALIAEGWTPPSGPPPHCLQCDRPAVFLDVDRDRGGALQPCGHGLPVGFFRLVERVNPEGYVTGRMFVPSPAVEGRA